MPARLRSEHAEPALRIVERDPLDKAGQDLLRRSQRIGIHLRAIYGSCDFLRNGGRHCDWAVCERRRAPTGQSADDFGTSTAKGRDPNSSGSNPTADARQADGLQGRIRGRPPLHQRRLSQAVGRDVQWQNEDNVSSRGYSTVNRLRSPPHSFCTSGRYQTWPSSPSTIDCDVVVMGSGSAALSAALRAATGGLSVTILEKAGVLGARHARAAAKGPAYSGSRSIVSS